MKQPKLKYHFYNPNPPDKCTDCILNILIEANAIKAETAIRKFTAGLEVSTEKQNINC